MIDERNGRPVATAVTKLPRGTINFEVYSNERIMGEVASVPTHNHPGSLSYDQGGEFFFLPYSAPDMNCKHGLTKVKIYNYILSSVNLFTFRVIKFHFSSQLISEPVQCAQEK